jgi:HKD family nuclease
MRATFLSGPFASGTSLNSHLLEQLRSTKFNDLTVAVAWVKTSGLKLVEPWLRDFSAERVLDITVGVDQGGASEEGLQLLLDLTPDSYVAYTPSGGTFHPKIYRFAGDAGIHVIVGSSNLTRGGLISNYEASVALDLDYNDEHDMKVAGEIDDYLQLIRRDDTTVLLTAELIDQLVASGMVESEKSNAGNKRIIRERELKAAPILPFKKSRHPIERVGGSSTVSGPPVPIESETNDEDSVEFYLPLATHRWFKPLGTASNSARPRPGSNTTGALRLTKSGAHLDQTHWFRYVLFGTLDWKVTHSARPTREWANGEFHVFLGNDPLGVVEFRLSHDPLREAGQNNFTTDLKWGSFAGQLADVLETHRWLAIDDADGNLNLRFLQKPPSTFLL